jgi:hypothetical protein
MTQNSLFLHFLKKFPDFGRLFHVVSNIPRTVDKVSLTSGAANRSDENLNKKYVRIWKMFSNQLERVSMKAL